VVLLSWELAINWRQILLGNIRSSLFPFSSSSLSLSTCTSLCMSFFLLLSLFMVSLGLYALLFLLFLSFYSISLLLSICLTDILVTFFFFSFFSASDLLFYCNCVSVVAPSSHPIFNCVISSSTRLLCNMLCFKHCLKVTIKI
jgi:hypothetical protein